MKVLVTGSTGQLGRALASSCPADVTLVALNRAQLDLSDVQALRRRVLAESPDVLINAAAYTAVDAAESDRDSAFAINAAAPAAMARACRELGARLIHVSTDFVFDGAAGSPRQPDSPAAPLGVYGESKLAGEREIAAVASLSWRTIRTAWVYSPWGRNFLLTMLRVLRESGLARVVSDQVGTPTSVFSLAECAWRAARDPGPSGILHFTDAGAASWYDFAQAIAEEAIARGLLDPAVRVQPIGTQDYPMSARRPAYSVLDSRATYERLGIEPLHWRVALRKVLEEVEA